jgi:hypothetical protein
MDAAVEKAKVKAGKRAPTMHDFRHTFASLLIAQGLDVVFVSRQLGHANPATTLKVYASEFDRVRNADAAPLRALGAVRRAAGRKRRRNRSPKPAATRAPERRGAKRLKRLGEAHRNGLRLLWEQEAGGSNPPVPTLHRSPLRLAAVA